MGSCSDWITQNELAFRLNFISNEIKEKLIDEAVQIFG
jgi:hypothetical protein